MHAVYARAFYTWARSAILVCAAVTVTRCGGAEPPPSYRPVATVDQVMDGIVIPSSQAIFDAIVYENGVLVQTPKVDDDWFRLQMHALAVAEAGNLLLMPGRVKDTGDWQTMAHALTDSAVKVAQAAEAKDVDRMLATGGELYSACVGCHQKYVPE
jgi:hypothetical protein